MTTVFIKSAEGGWIAEAVGTEQAVVSEDLDILLAKVREMFDPTPEPEEDSSRSDNL